MLTTIGSYSQVLHATENLGTTLANVRKMLRPGGTLLLQELCTSTKWINLIMVSVFCLPRPALDI